MKRTGFFVAALGVALAATTVTATSAHAEDGELGEITPTAEPTPTPTGPSDMGAGGGPFKKGSLGFSVAVPGATPPYVLDIAYFLGEKAAIDIFLGLNFAKTPGVTDPITMMTTGGGSVFGFAVGGGYRMYKKVSDKIYTYIQPYLLLNAPTTEEIGDALQITLGGNFGGEAFLTDWFSFRGQVGAAFQIAQAGDVINAATTTGLFANVYWK